MPVRVPGNFCHTLLPWQCDTTPEELLACTSCFSGLLHKVVVKSFSHCVAERCAWLHKGSRANPVCTRGEGGDGWGEWGKRTPWGAAQSALHLARH